MKIQLKLHSPMLLIILFFAFITPTTISAAEPAGRLDTVDASRITGWTSDQKPGSKGSDVELRIYKEGSTETTKIITVTSDNYEKTSTGFAKDGYHYFNYPVDWAQMGGNTYIIEAYAISGDNRLLLDGTKKFTYTPGEEIGPGMKNKGVDTEPVVIGPKKGKSLGLFSTTGYCSCDICSSGSGITYSGTIPKASHTISADITKFPIGTKLMINDIIYTVEDIGSSISGNKLDIYYDTHEEALNHGRQLQEVFEVKL